MILHQWCTLLIMINNIYWWVQHAVSSDFT